jgi:hypothetical protein
MMNYTLMEWVRTLVIAVITAAASVIFLYKLYVKVSAWFEKKAKPVVELITGGEHRPDVRQLIETATEYARTAVQQGVLALRGVDRLGNDIQEAKSEMVKRMDRTDLDTAKQFGEIHGEIKGIKERVTKVENSTLQLIDANARMQQAGAMRGSDAKQSAEMVEKLAGKDGDH